MPFSFCENVHAGPLSPWHIRQLTDVGPKFTGGADSPALCGRKVHWDLEVKIEGGHLKHCCQACVQQYNESSL